MPAERLSNSNFSDWFLGLVALSRRSPLRLNMDKSSYLGQKSTFSGWSSVEIGEANFLNASNRPISPELSQSKTGLKSSVRLSLRLFSCLQRLR